MSENAAGRNKIGAETLKEALADACARLARKEEDPRLGPYLLYLPHFPAAGREVCVLPNLFGAEIREGAIGDDCCDRVYMYTDAIGALCACSRWYLSGDDEPVDWIRANESGKPERRRPGSDAQA